MPDSPTPAARLRPMFDSLSLYNYRLWAAGALVSNIGTWMQRTAQDWLVLSHLTAHSAQAVGIVMSLQFGPQLLLLPVTGMVADRMDRRRLLMLTQAAMGLLAGGLGLLTLLGVVQLWQVYAFAFALGCVAAFDSPVRQTFVGELVGEDRLANAVALNSASFQASRMIGPAVAGLLISLIGSGWMFVLNALSFLGVILALSLLEPEGLCRPPRQPGATGGIGEALRHVGARADLSTAMWMMFLVGTFGLNFPIFIAAMSVNRFHGDARQYGCLSAVMAVGSMLGSLLTARLERPRMGHLSLACLAFSLTCGLAILAPNVMSFGLLLVGIGAAAQVYSTSTNSLIQVRTEFGMRGRVMAIFMAILMGCTPLGAPLVGWLADHDGPRSAMAVAVLSGLLASAWGLRYRLRARRLVSA